MDQVSFSIPTSNFFLLNGQAVLFNQNGAIDSQTVNGEILQEDIFQNENSSKISGIDRSRDNAYENGGYVILKSPEKDNDCNLVQLTVQEAAELGIQLTIDNTIKTNEIEVQSAKNQDVTYQKVDETITKINGNTSTINFLTSDPLNEMTYSSKGLNEYALIPQYVNGQIAYAVQLTAPDQVQTAQNVGIPITVPTMEVSSVTSAENDLSKLVAPVETVVNKNPQVSSSGTSSESFIPNPRIRILSKVKNPDLKKNNQRKFVPINKDKYNLKHQRKLVPQKMLLPPLTKGKESVNDNKLFQISLGKLIDSRQEILTSNESVSTESLPLNPPLLKPQIVERQNENISVNCENVKGPSSNLPSLNGNQSAPVKAGHVVQVLTIPQGGQLPKKIFSYSMPNDNKSGRKLTPSQLMQIAAAMQKNCINRTTDISNSSTLYDIETNPRIICRVFYPEDLVSQEEKTPVVVNPKKRGRPIKKEIEPEKPEKGTDRVPARTRSGRVTRPPRIFEDYKRLRRDESYSDYSGTDDNIENSSSVDLLPGLNHQKRKFSSQFRCPTCNKVYLGRVRMAVHFNKYPDHCDSKQLELLKESAPNEDFDPVSGEPAKSTWRKGLMSSKGKRKSKRKMLGRLPLDEVLDAYNKKDVMQTCGRRVASMLSTWEMLLLRLENEEHKGKCKVQAFLDELEAFVKSVREVSPQILKPPNCEQPNINLSNDTISSLLGIEKGWYSSEDNGFPQPFGPIKENSPPKQFEIHNSDEDCTANNNNNITERTQTLKDEQDVVKVKEELSELDTLCVQDDPLGVDSVDQIVSERLKTMAPVDDLVSTLPAMPATSTDELVRGLLTDDLINSLETFIPPTHPPPDLDFTVLSSEFSSSR